MKNLSESSDTDSRDSKTKSNGSVSLSTESVLYFRIGLLGDKESLKRSLMINYLQEETTQEEVEFTEKTMGFEKYKFLKKKLTDKINF